MADLAHALSEAPLFDAAFCETFAELVAWRRDVRHFRPGEAPDEATLAELFDLAALAPSVGNCQPTRFVRVDEEARRAAIRSNFEAANRAALAAYAGERAALYARLKLAGLRDAPIQIAVFCDEATEQGHGLGARTMPEARRYSAVCALHTFWLAARARGLGVGWVSILDPATIAELLDVAARVDLHRLSLCGLSARGSSDPGARARGLAKPRAAPGSAPIGSRSRLDLIRLWTDEDRRPTRPFPGSLPRSADRD